MEIFEIPIIDDDLLKLAVRFAFNLFFLVLIVRFGIYPRLRDRDFLFTAVMMNITAFFICFTLKKLDLGLGMALGLFAIFGVLRYRTDAIRTKEMTYLFILIGVAVINSLSNKQTSYVELITVNTVILIAAVLKETIVGRTDDNGSNGNGEKSKSSSTTKPKKQRKYTVVYDKLEWLGPQHRDKLIADLVGRLGIDVRRVQIQDIDLTSSQATLTIWYEDTIEDPTEESDVNGDERPAPNIERDDD